MWLIVGLGNPGSKYEVTRHNFGFLAIDALIDRHSLDGAKNAFHGMSLKCEINEAPCLLLKPMTYMNRSGKSVQAAAQFFKINKDQIIVIHDDIDLSLGDVRIKKGGSNGGHNGLKDISRLIGNDYIRIRLGVGRPNIKGTEADYVLRPFLKSEINEVELTLNDCASAIEILIKEGLEAACQKAQIKK